ncbi:MAG: hypothetical protein HRU19_21075 [Pseudobacteriovorax sp.]|nr:hypothetical protein [Pseudobacteriovorax sp.]
MKVLCTLVLFSAMLAGCGSSGGSSDNPTAVDPKSKDSGKVGNDGTIGNGGTTGNGGNGGEAKLTYSVLITSGSLCTTYENRTRDEADRNKALADGQDTLTYIEGFCPRTIEGESIVAGCTQENPKTTFWYYEGGVFSYTEDSVRENCDLLNIDLVLP